MAKANDRPADMMVSLSKIMVVPERNPRTVFNRGELESLKEQIKGVGGVLVPLIVEYPDSKGMMGLINGERRFRALTELADEGHVYKVPVHFQKVKDEKEVLQFALVANEGEPLTLVDKAEAYKKFLTLGGDRKELASMLGKTNAHLTQMLTVSNAPAAVKKQLAAGKITMSNALDLCKEAGVTTTGPMPPVATSVAPPRALVEKETKEETKARVEASTKAAEVAKQRKEEELAAKAEAMAAERQATKEGKRATAKVVKESGITLDAHEKVILEVLRMHGVDGLVSKAHRAVEVAKKAATDKKEVAKWTAVENILGVVNTALEEEGWD